MALFTDTRELDRQESVANLSPSGNEVALNMLGYDKYGQLNTWGKVNPMIGGGVTNKIASKVATGETKETFEKSQAAANKHTLDKIKFAADIVTLGTGSAVTKGVSKGIGMIQGGENTDIGKTIKGIAGKNDSMDSLNNKAEKSTEVGPGGVDSFGDAVLTDNPAEDGLSAEGIAKFQEFMKENPDGTRELFEKTMKENGGMENLFSSVGAEKAIGMTDALPVIGSAISAIGSGVAYDEELKKNRVLDGKKTMNTFNYL